MDKSGKRFTAAGTNIEEVKRRNAAGGKSYNEVLNALSIGTNPQKVREEIAEEAGPFAFGGQGQAQAGKTAAGTDIAEVRRQNAQAGNGQNPLANKPMREEIAQEFSPNSSTNGTQFGKTMAGTDIAEVRRQIRQAEQKKK